MEEEKGAEEEAEEPYVDYVRGGPGDSIVGKVMWALSLPLMIPMWCSIPDPQDKDRERYYPIAFLMSIIWIAIFSYFMVWWATLTGETLGIRYEIIEYVGYIQTCCRMLGRILKSLLKFFGYEQNYLIRFKPYNRGNLQHKNTFKKHFTKWEFSSSQFHTKIFCRENDCFADFQLFAK